METSIKVLPSYASINAVVEICEPWIELWGGDEWGESMQNLAAACHTDYGFSDEDCALFASKLFENLEWQKRWVDEEGYAYGFKEPEDIKRVQEKAREVREYWRKGGNLTTWQPAIDAANETINTMPGWLFGE